MRVGCGFWVAAEHEYVIARPETSRTIGIETESPLVARVFALLADGQFHSGEDLAQRLSVSRSAVWKAANTLRELGATLHAVRNRGYRLTAAAEPLDAARIRARLPKTVGTQLKSVEVFWSVDSTNTTLMRRPNPPVGSSEALLAEYQTAGRGRRGRTWVAPPGGAICLSLSWTFAAVPRDLGALGLVVGVCARRALGEQGLRNIRLKWPNDLLVEDCKLGGVLIELRAESGGPACVVIGIGLNVMLGDELIKALAQSGPTPIDLVSSGLAEPSRNEIAAALIGSFVSGLLEFSGEGLRPFLGEWRDADALRGRAVCVQAGEQMTRGLARGVDPNGALLVETDQGLQRFISGDVTVRAAA